MKGKTSSTQSLENLFIVFCERSEMIWDIFDMNKEYMSNGLLCWDEGSIVADTQLILAFFGDESLELEWIIYGF